MEIRIKDGTVTVPDDFVLLGTKDDFEEAGGVSVLEFRNGSSYGIPDAVIPTAEYKESSDEEEERGIYAMVRRFPQVGILMKVSLSPTEMLKEIRAGHDVDDDGIWPLYSPLYREDDPDYDALVSMNMVHDDAKIIPN